LFLSLSLSMYSFSLFCNSTKIYTQLHYIARALFTWHIVCLCVRAHMSMVNMATFSILIVTAYIMLTILGSLPPHHFLWTFHYSKLWCDL
jgi:hypothetical protein